MGVQGEEQEARHVLYPSPKPKQEQAGNYSVGDEFLLLSLPHACADIVQHLLLPFMRLLVLPDGFINADSFGYGRCAQPALVMAASLSVGTQGG